MILKNRSVFPFDKLEFENDFGSIAEGGLKNIDRIKRRVIGNVSYFKIGNK